MQRDTISKGFEDMAISKEKQDLIYELSMLEEYKHPMKIITKIKRHRVRSAGSVSNSTNTIRGAKYHYLSGKINFTKIAKAVGVSIFTVIRYLKCQHRKSRESDENHKRYLKQIESGAYERMIERAKSDRKKYPKKWALMQKKWIDNNKDKKRGYDKKQYNKQYPLINKNCLVCDGSITTRSSVIKYCSDDCKDLANKKWMKEYYLENRDKFNKTKQVSHDF